MQAILLLAHKGFDYIDNFCSQFNGSNDFHIFIHYDTKMVLTNDEKELLLNKYPIKGIISKHTGTYFGMDLIDAEIELIKLSKQFGEYKYYHLMSEQCFIITELNTFINFFNNSTDEYLVIEQDKEGWQILNYDKNYRYAGSQWWSLSNECIEWILNVLETTNYYDEFKYEHQKFNAGKTIRIIAADETFFTNMVMVFDNNFNFVNNKRYYDFTWPLVDFSHPHPIVNTKLKFYINDGMLGNLIIRKVDYKNNQSNNVVNIIKQLNKYVS